MDTEDITLGIAVAGAVFGFVGTALSVLNTKRAFDRDRVTIQVRPVWVMHENGRDGFGIAVRNLSYFPVTVTGLGFTLGGDERLAFLPSDISGCKLPERMEARTSFTAILPVGPGDHPEWAAIRKAYADTACGLRVTGSSPALRQKISQCRVALASSLASSRD